MDAERRADFDATGNTKEPQVPQPVEILMACFGQALQMWIEEKLVDIRKGIETGLTNNIVQLRQQIKDADAKTARLKKLQGKIKFTGEGPNFPDAQIDSILNAFAEEKKKRERLLSDHEAALAMLPSFIFPSPETPIQTMAWPFQLYGAAT